MAGDFWGTLPRHVCNVDVLRIYTPPIFSKRNAKRYALVLYAYVVKANDDDLKVLAHEIARSALSLVRVTRIVVSSFAEAQAGEKGYPALRSLQRRHRSARRGGPEHNETVSHAKRL